MIDPTVLLRQVLHHFPFHKDAAVANTQRTNVLKALSSHSARKYNAVGVNGFMLLSLVKHPQCCDWLCGFCDHCLAEERTGPAQSTQSVNEQGGGRLRGSKVSSTIADGFCALLFMWKRPNLRGFSVRIILCLNRPVF